MSRISQRGLNILGLVTLTLIIVGLYMAFLYAQTEARMGMVYRIFFFHLGAIIASTVAVLVVAVAGVAYSFALTPEMTQTLMVAITAFILLYLYLLIQRVRLEELHDDVLALQRALAK
ncbi:MAG: hypothetical protein HY257_02455 [Chloroflexi bacterium]|nr:hypothetical protein [Chloroflexota bacterium]